MYKTQLPNSRQSGFSLVELMITLVLGLFIMLVTTAFYVSNKQTYRYINASTEILQSSQYALYYLRETIGHAGFPLQNGVGAFPANVADRTNPNVTPVLEGPGNNSDIISVTYRATNDCLGNPSPLDAGGNPIATNVFSIQDLDANGIPDLVCDGDNVVGGNPAQILIRGVQNMQIEYGVDTNTDGIPDTFADAQLVENGISGPGPEWGSVVAVRIALLMRSQNPVAEQVGPVSYQVLNTVINTNDQFKRRVFTTTIPLRNTVI